jgi:hypothetical protein
MDVEGILAFAERILPSASNLWVHSSLNQKQRLQQLFFPDGIRSDGKKACWDRHNAAGFQLLKPCFGGKKDLVDQTSASWNRLTSWLRRVEALRAAA